MKLFTLTGFTRSGTWAYGPQLPPGGGAPGNWIMPYSVRCIRIDQIKPSGLVDYYDGLSHMTMTDAPFGGTLYFSLQNGSTFPTSNVYYYRYSYRKQGGSTWTDFHETVSVHYVKYRPAQTPIFPTYKLGPVEVNGMNLNLIRFGGDLIVKSWIRNFKKESFSLKLKEVKNKIFSANNKIAE